MFLFQNVPLHYQISLYMYLSLMWMIYLATVMPFREKSLNYYELWNEAFCWILGGHAICFILEGSQDAVIQVMMGWSFVFFIGLNILSGMAYVCYEAVKVAIADFKTRAADKKEQRRLKKSQNRAYIKTENAHGLGQFISALDIAQNLNSVADQITESSQLPFYCEAYKIRQGKSSL
jgi:hypothetical protein